jgi:ABC-type polysaccharide/polyol phosphate export permease
MAVTSLTNPKLAPATTGAAEDLLRGFRRWDIWGRLGWLDIKRRYQRTMIGPYWSALSLAIFVTATGIVGAGLWNQAIGDYLPFLAGGMVVWMLISTIITESTALFVNGSSFLRQLPFDYSILAYALVWRNFIAFLHNLSVFVVVVLLLKPSLVQPVMLLAIPGVALVLLNGTWIALLLGMFCLRFRDMQQFVASIIQISMFVTPIFWSADNLPYTRRVVFVVFNPLYHLIEVVRAPLLAHSPTLTTYLAVLLITATGWMLTFAVFRYFRRRLAYWS